MARLPPPQRRIFEYVFLEGHSHVAAYELLRTQDGIDLPFGTFLRELSATYRAAAGASNHRGRVAVELGGAEPVQGPDPPDMDAVVQAEQAGVLADALAALAPDERDVLGFGAPVTFAPFLGTVSSTSLNFGGTLVVQPAASLPWDGDEFVTFGSVPSSFVVASDPDAIKVVVPRLPLGPRTLFVFQQGTEQRLEALPITVTSTFTPIGLDQLTTAPDISGGPFPMSFFIELSKEDPDHVVTVAPAADLPLTVRLEWQTGADLDIYWTNSDGSEFVGNQDGATLANPEQTSVTVPAGETWRLRFNRFESSPGASTAPPTLARVTIRSP